MVIMNLIVKMILMLLCRCIVRILSGPWNHNIVEKVLMFILWEMGM